MRGIAILFVVVSHARLPGFEVGGTVGVTVFFVLSGFLITCLLLEERERAGRIRLKVFYYRRGLRLLPALAAFLAVLALLSVASGAPQVIPSRSDLAMVALYVGNWRKASSPEHDLGSMGHTWSLAVEEQFYLLWPLALLLLRTRRRVAWGAAAGIVISAVLRVTLAAGGSIEQRYLYGTDTRADALLLGCLLAAIAPHLARPPAWCAPVALASLVALGTQDSHLMAVNFAPWFSVFLVWGAAAHWNGWLAAGPFVHLGTLSYSLYLWHFPLLWWIAPGLPLPRLAAVAVMMGLSFALAVLSYRFVERPFLQLKCKVRSLHVDVVDPHRPRTATA